jgi:adenosylcobinamide-phosphate synthase
MMLNGWELLAGAGLDLLLGDPPWMPHPVRAIGWWAGRMEKVLRGRFQLRLAGVVFWFAVVAPSAALVALTLLLPRPLPQIYWTYSLLAIRSLDAETTAAVKALRRGDLEASRKAIARVVGRDTAGLDEEGVVRAAIETIAENLSDAVVAPIFYLTLGGPVLMAAYKALNTLDSTVGYKNDRYREFGWFSARADDWANWIPARITSGLIAIAALVLGLNAAKTARIVWRDGASQPSPNAGWPEAAMGGALGVQLGGVNYYGGVPSGKPFLGDPLRPLSTETYACARLILYMTSAISIAIAWSLLR